MQHVHATEAGADDDRVAFAQWQDFAVRLRRVVGGHVLASVLSLADELVDPCRLHEPRHHETGGSSISNHLASLMAA
jgi:hypothetical protein